MKKENQILLEHQLKSYLNGIFFDNDTTILSHYLSLQGTSFEKTYQRILERNSINLKQLPSQSEFLNKYALFPPQNKLKFSFIDLFVELEALD